MLQILADVLMIATRQNPRRPAPDHRRRHEEEEAHRRRVWSLIAGIRY